MVLGVQVVGSLELGCALKSGIIRIPSSNYRLDSFKYLKAILRWQLELSSLLETAEKLIMLRGFDVVDDSDKHT
jgi:hypothetical protein